MMWTGKFAATGRLALRGRDFTGFHKLLEATQVLFNLNLRLFTK